MNNFIKLSFKIPDKNSSVVSMKNDVEALKLVFENGYLMCLIRYDFNERPLTLISPANGGDSVEMILMSFRNELWINGKLCDEEWPAGNRFYDIDDIITGDFEVKAELYEYTKKDEPTIIDTFTNAEGWHPEENVFVGDCMPFYDEGRYHVLYLKDRRHHSSKWSLGAHQWAHISTNDFINWQIHPLAVEITDQSEASICTGSWIKHDGVHYLYYTVRNNDFYEERFNNNSPASVHRSISHDGYHFEKDRDFSVTLSKNFHGPTARDPKIIMDENGIFHMLVTTTYMPEDRGCLAHLTSEDLVNWTELNDPVYISDDPEQPECPDCFKYGDYYYILGSIRGKAHYMYSRTAFKDWIIPDERVIPCSSVPKGAIWKDKVIFTGFNAIGGYGGSMTFTSAYQNDKGELIFE